MTPSGFYIGTILNTKQSLSTWASGAWLTKKSMMPFIIHDALVSPGCTLDEMNTPFFASALSDFGSLSLLVMVMYSQRFPARVLVSV
jgi:hypothetical protein